MSVTTFLASYAAIISTVDLLWKLKNSRVDSGKLEVCGLLAATTRNRTGESFPHRYRLDMPIQQLDEDNRSLVLQATNVGRRPITIECWKPLYSSCPSNSFPLARPQELGESQSTDIYIHDLDPLREGAIGIAIQDSHGRLWRLPDAQFRALQEAMLRFRL